MPLHRRHGLHKPDAGGIEGPDDPAREPGRERGSAFAVSLSNGVAVFDMSNRGEQILSTSNRNWVRVTLEREKRRTSSSKDMSPLTTWISPYPVAKYSRSLLTTENDEGVRNGWSGQHRADGDVLRRVRPVTVLLALYHMRREEEMKRVSDAWEVGEGFVWDVWPFGCCRLPDPIRGGIVQDHGADLGKESPECGKNCLSGFGAQQSCTKRRAAV